MNKMTIHEWAIMVHEASGTIGQVLETVYSADVDQTQIKQRLLLKNKACCELFLVELRLASEDEAREFLRES